MQKMRVASAVGSSFIFNLFIKQTNCIFIHHHLNIRTMSDLINFEGQEIRQTNYNGETYFSIVDVVAVLTDSKDPKQYLKRLRQRDEQLKIYMGTNCTPVAMITRTGKQRNTLAGNRESVFRIIQSIPSPKAEPFKQWLAQTAEERLQETEDPTQAMDRVRQSFRDLGYPDDWIETRIKTKKGRIELTNEWQRRGISKQKEYAELTAILSGAAFGVIPSDHKRIKGLEKENLRDHMTREELIFTELAELQTKNVTIEDDAQGLEENKEAAKKGGIAAGAARQAFEKEAGRKVVSSNNFLNQIKAAKDKLLGGKKKE